MPIDARWVGRVALVTGASAGIGAAIARRLVSCGMHVVAAARRLDRLETLAAENPDKVTAIKTDLRDAGSIAALFETVRGKLGGVDVVVNNAGLGHASSLIDGDTEKWREMLEVNVLALCIATREAVADMRRREREGYVIHISSMSAHRVPNGSGVYSATKFAVRSLTEGLRQELHAAALPIRVSSISPGFVETEFAVHYHSGDANTHDAHTKARETYSRYPVLQPPDIANAVEFLLSQPAHVQYQDMLVRPSRQLT